MIKKKIERYDGVWDAITDTPDEAENLLARSELMNRITLIVEECGWTQVTVAKVCGVTQPRINWR